MGELRDLMMPTSCFQGDSAQIQEIILKSGNMLILFYKEMHSFLPLIAAHQIKTPAKTIQCDQRDQN